MRYCGLDTSTSEQRSAMILSAQGALSVNPFLSLSRREKTGTNFKMISRFWPIWIIEPFWFESFRCVGYLHGMIMSIWDACLGRGHRFLQQVESTGFIFRGFAELLAFLLWSRTKGPLFYNWAGIKHLIATMDVHPSTPQTRFISTLPNQVNYGFASILLVILSRIKLIEVEIWNLDQDQLIEISRKKCSSCALVPLTNWGGNKSDWKG